MLFYFIPACCVFVVFVSALYLNDPEPIDSFQLWTFIVLAALLWPLTLPSMLAKAGERCWMMFSQSEAK
jgi:hypothetical protein